jgi:hypothetical protein
MPTPTITPGNILPAASAAVNTGIAGASIIAGKPIYLDTATSTYKVAGNDTAAKANVAGIALTTSASGQPVSFCLGGDLGMGAVLETGIAYCLGASGVIQSLDSVLNAGTVDVVNSTTDFSSSSLIIPTSYVGKPVAIYDASASYLINIRYITFHDTDAGEITFNAATTFTMQAAADTYKVLNTPTYGGDGTFLTILGIATSTSNLHISLNASSIAQA